MEVDPKMVKLRVPQQSLPTTSLNLEDTQVTTQLSSVDSSVANSLVGDDEDTIVTGSLTSRSRSVLSFRPSMNNSNPGRSYDSNDAEFDLIRTLDESLYSVDGAITKSYVSNEIPDIFDTDIEDVSTKNFFIFTSAGKPVFTMNENDSESTSYIGLLTSIISYFQVSAEDDIKSFTTEKSKAKFVFLNKTPIFYVAYSQGRDETKQELNDQLEFLHSYILSTLTRKQLMRYFEKRQNFDLRSHLESTDFDSLTEICERFTDKLYPELYLNALQCLDMRKSMRSKFHKIMAKELEKMDDMPRGTLLYSFIIAPNNRICSVLRPKSHTLHPTDLQILFLVISTQFQNLEAQKELWIPLCFPKFNSNGYLYCYIKNLINPLESNIAGNTNNPSVIVAISGQKDAFFKMKMYCDSLIKELQNTKSLLQQLQANILKPYSVADIPAPLVHHFIFKSRKHIQYTMPQLESNSADSYQKMIYEKKLKLYYQSLENSVTEEMNNNPNKVAIIFIQWRNETTTDEIESIKNSTFIKEPINMLGMAWVTPKFELYLICNNGIQNKNVALNSARRIVHWCNKHESRLFINEGAIF
ncbi:Vacuolar fusion protein MON1 [Nakaseomyces bracarensis]|uniref:Vacuolar fusion protein MON1 n=1 Tax=Nakaseomyces bracarensis TaxID=273131 RepID=A0ABR4NPQ1_9SACH